MQLTVLIFIFNYLHHLEILGSDKINFFCVCVVPCISFFLKRSYLFAFQWFFFFFEQPITSCCFVYCPRLLTDSFMQEEAFLSTVCSHSKISATTSAPDTQHATCEPGRNWDQPQSFLGWVWLFSSRVCEPWHKEEWNGKSQGDPWWVFEGTHFQLLDKEEDNMEWHSVKDSWKYR